MKVLRLKRREIDARGLLKCRAEESDTETVVREPAVIVDDASGEVVAIYALLGQKAEKLANELDRVKYQTTERVSGLKTTSRIFGYMPRIPLRSDYCRMAGLDKENPLVTGLLQQFGYEAEQFYRTHAPERYARHLELTKQVLPDYRLGESVFTSGIINQNNPLKYHYDSGNFDGVFSCMIGFKNGMEGGYLSIPEYNVALEIANHSVSLFDGQNLLHGVTPMKKIWPYGTRYTVVYYSLKGMWKCETGENELKRIRRVKMERERKRTTKPKN